MHLLRLITCGSVDDGKSTLIGRLLFDSHAVSPDVLEAIERQSGPAAAPNLALLTDGLRSEREQGITIDVAYKYFTTNRRKFILADAPGHIQYTRNMVSGASNADAALILVDARNGVIEQTRRHTAIAALLGIPHLIVCINKMDLAAYRSGVFDNIVVEFEKFAGSLHFSTRHFLPMSALTGENVVRRAENMPWYLGPALLEYLENLEHGADRHSPARFQVQYVIRPQSADLHDYRGYAGQVQSGAYRQGDRVRVFPSGISTTISAIEVHQQQVEHAQAPQPAVFHLTDQIDISRGASIVPEDHLPQWSQDLTAMLCVTADQPLRRGDRLLLQHHSATVKAIVQGIDYKLDIRQLDKIPNPEALNANDLGLVRLRTSAPLAFDPYLENRKTGAFILIHEQQRQTVAAGMLQPADSDDFA